MRFLRAAVKLGWAREAKDLWRALDKDESGTASLDELDPVAGHPRDQLKVLIYTRNTCYMQVIILSNSYTSY